MNKSLGTFLFPIILCYACTAPTTRLVFMEGEQIEGTSLAKHEILICNPPRNLGWTIWGQFQLAEENMSYATDDSEADFTNYDALCYRITPRITADTVHFRFIDRFLPSHSRAPMGFYLQERNGSITELPIEYHFLPVAPDAPDTYNKTSLMLTDILPQVKQVQMLPGESKITNVEISFVGNKKPSWYRLTINNTTTVEAADDDGAYYACKTLNKLRENAGTDQLPNLIIEDWPDFPIRPLMLDLGRNFLSVEQVCDIIDVMDRNKANMLMLHLAEDEGWRLEIKGLPELTEYGAFHAIPTRQADGSYLCADGLMPSQDGHVGREKPWQSATGFFTREEYKQILRYAAERHIEVLPELELPGHSGSAIEAMRYRARTTGDTSFLLTDPNDQSVHTAVYGYKDNIVDVSLPSVYHFLGTVLDDLKAIYEEAGLTLSRVNISGDEVPDGCWMDSPSARKLMAENGWSTAEELWTYFIGKAIDVFAERDIAFVAYDEALDVTDEAVLEKIRQNTSFLISWRPTTINDGYPVHRTYHFVDEGFPILLSHADYTYMDNVYTHNRLEQGLCWAGATDERKAFSYRPFDILSEGVTLAHPENIMGVEPMLWGDNVYTYPQACYLLFPKVYGLFERSWNAHSDNSDTSFGKFYSIVTERELPFLEAKGMNHRTPMVPQ